MTTINNQKVLHDGIVFAPKVVTVIGACIRTYSATILGQKYRVYHVSGDTWATNPEIAHMQRIAERGRK